MTFREKIKMKMLLKTKKALKRWNYLLMEKLLASILGRFGNM